MNAPEKEILQMDVEQHWERIYGTKAPYQPSWYRPHLETSLSLIERVGNERSAAIIDVGGGPSTLVDDLIGRRYPKSPCATELYRLQCERSHIRRIARGRRAVS